MYFILYLHLQSVYHLHCSLTRDLGKLSQVEQTEKIWVVGLYYWHLSSVKSIRERAIYDRHVWVDIDTDKEENIKGVLQVFKKENLDCVIHRCNRGWHVFGDLVDYPRWRMIWEQVKQYADPNWHPHSLRISKKRPEELWLKAEWVCVTNNPMPNWAKALCHYINKIERGESEDLLKKSIARCGLNKYWETAIYPIELKVK